MHRLARLAAPEQARLGREQFVAILHNEAHLPVDYARDSNLGKHVERMAAAGIPRPPAGAAFFYQPNQSARWQIEAPRSDLAQLDTLPSSSLVIPKPDRRSATIPSCLPHPNNAFGRHYSANGFVDFSSTLRLRQLIWSVGDTRHEPTEAPSPPAAIKSRPNSPGPGPAGNTDA